MATLLLEIGCEELPGGGVPRGRAQLPELARRVLGVEPDRSSSRRAGSRCSPMTCPSGPRTSG